MASLPQRFSLDKEPTVSATTLMKGGQRATDTQYIYMQSLIGGGIYHEAGSDMTGTDTLLLCPPDRLSLVSDSLKQFKVGNLVPSSYRLMIFRENQRGRQSKQSRLLGFDQACKINLQRKQNKIPSCPPSTNHYLLCGSMWKCHKQSRVMLHSCAVVNAGVRMAWGLKAAQWEKPRLSLDVH